MVQGQTMVVPPVHINHQVAALQAAAEVPQVEAAARVLVQAVAVRQIPEEAVESNHFTPGYKSKDL